LYTLKKTKIKGFLYLELKSSNNESRAQISLKRGSRLNSLVFKNTQILADFDPLNYEDYYASSVLFPFANSIKDVEYTFEDSKYKLDCNETEKNNALHGLMYNKSFTCIRKEFNSDYASVALHYKDDGKVKGFQFKFNIELTYTLRKYGIILSVKVVNKGKKTFPFVLGWHPYFNSVDLDSSAINFKSKKKYVFENQQIISGVTHSDIEMPYELKDLKLDDGYALETNEIDFSTSEYVFNIRSTSIENFLQLYTPDQPNIIAIESMTGATDNFNNKTGLQTLDPNQTYNLTWDMAIETLLLS
jgi:aldose 1-epimerase